MSKLFIFGCGGVGSNLAYLLTKLPSNHRFYLGNESNTLFLIDHDTVEMKNLSRQFYFSEDVGKSKVEALRDNLIKIIPNANIETYNKKIECAEDCILFSAKSESQDLWILATDNVKSKRLLANECSCTFWLVNCDKDYFEIKYTLDKEETNAWDLDAGGYMNEQTFTANMYSALIMFDLMCSSVYDPNMKVNLNKLIRANMVLI